MTIQRLPNLPSVFICVYLWFPLLIAWSDEPPRFSRDVAPIVFANCSECHRPDYAAPFSLLSYNDVKKRAKQIVEVTQSRYMPPWLPKRGGHTVQFEGARGLSDQQLQIIREWVENGAPEGDPKVLSPPPQYKGGWTLGAPDLVLTLNEPYTLPAQTYDTIRTFVFSIPLSEAKVVRAIDFDPGTFRAVHHASFLVDITGAAHNLDEADPQPGYPSMGDIGLNLAGSFGTWSAGSGPLQFREGIGRILPNDSDFSVEMHFNPTGKPETIQPRVALYFAKGPVEHHVVSISLGSFFIDIAPGEKEYTVRDSFTLPVDTKLLSLAPHAHYICRRMRVIATLPDGNEHRLLAIDDWDFNWLQEFRLTQPLDLPAETRIEMEFVYDNSAENPRNPTNPPRRVTSGATVQDEMALVFLNLIAAEEQDRPDLERANRNKLLQRMREAQAKRAQER